MDELAAKKLKPSLDDEAAGPRGLAVPRFDERGDDVAADDDDEDDDDRVRVCAGNNEPRTLYANTPSAPNTPTNSEEPRPIAIAANKIYAHTAKNPTAGSSDNDTESLRADDDLLDT